MARKKPPEEHEDLERWLVSYGDFITLLFATFVVLYALAQSDAVDYQKLEEALKNVFDSSNILDAQEMILDGNKNVFDQYQSNSFIPGLMMETLSKRYEDEAFKEIEEQIRKLKKAGELEGISAKMTEFGLLITFDDKYLSAGTKRFPADLDKATETIIKDTVKKVYRKLDFNGVVRMDFLLSDGEVYLNEINSVPGSLAYYLFCDGTDKISQFLSTIIEDGIDEYLRYKSNEFVYRGGVLNGLGKLKR